MVKKSRKKLRRDPNAPKAPRNPYWEFALEEKGKVLESNGKMSVIEISKEIGRRWQNLDEESRLKYDKIYKEKRRQYEEVYASYVAENFPLAEEVSSKVCKKSRKKRNPSAIKRPLSSFMEFSKDNRQKVVEDGYSNLAEISKELGVRWKNASDEVRKEYEIKGKENKDAYEKALRNNDTARSSSSLALPVATVSSDVSHNNLSQQEDVSPVQESNLGFAQMKSFPWHPAIKIGEIAKGSRIKVKFFGNGHIGIVNQNKWVQFTDQSESKLKTTNNLIKSAVFRQGLDQMKKVKQKILDEPGSVTFMSSIDSLPQTSARTFKILNKDHLQKEDETNRNLMNKKMRQDVDSKWRCKDCGWRGRYRHKAKSHARECGVMKKIYRKKKTGKKYECSSFNCELSFSSRESLAKHYR